MGVQTITIEPGRKVHMKDLDPGDTGKYKDRDDAEAALAANLERLAELQERLYASGSHALLVVLQGMDTSGKDGLVKHVATAFNPQGVAVTSFKVPTAEEAAHDFLWRVHKAVPGKGMIGIFNRSHYEDVLVVRVAGLQPKSVWSRRYDQINDFEKLLTASGVTIVKLFLHISAREQEERLRERQQTPEKQWKFSPGDLEVRTQWSAYMEAYDDVLERCSTPWAPWHVVPANHKWYRNLVASELLVDALEDLHLEYPKPVENVGSYVIPPAG